VREFTEYLAEFAPEPVMAVLNSNFEQYASENLAMVTVVLGKCKEYRPVLDYMHIFRDYSIVNEDELWQRCVECHRGPIIDVSTFVEAFELASLSKSTRTKCFEVFGRICWQEDTFLAVMRTNHGCLGRKAALWLQLGYDSFDLMTLCCNSYKALDVLCDHMIESQPENFIGHAPNILRKSYQNTHTTFLISMPKQMRNVEPSKRSPPVMGRMSTQWTGTGDRKLLAAPYIRYARAVMPTLGRETVLEYMRGHTLVIDRSIRFLADVLGDVKENGLNASDFEGIFEGMKIIADLKPPFDRGLLERFAGLLQDPEISARYEFPRREKLIELALKYLEPETTRDGANNSA
jgi:hypothetical protein